MSGKAGASGTAGSDDRKARLAAELRANLARRKAQARSRRTGEADERPDGIGTVGSGAAGKEANPSGEEDGR